MFFFVCIFLTVLCRFQVVRDNYAAVLACGDPLPDYDSERFDEALDAVFGKPTMSLSKHDGSESAARGADERPDGNSGAGQANATSHLDAPASPSVKTECEDLESLSESEGYRPLVARRGCGQTSRGTRRFVAAALPLQRRSSKRVALRNATPGPSRKPISQADRGAGSIRSRRGRKASRGA